MKLYRNVYEVKIVRYIEKRLLSLSQFLSYFPLNFYRPFSTTNILMKLYRNVYEV